ncbi:hypothetical protein EJ04DRAFT_562095 [Polyplosphaeria fusca]|uniref:Histone-lysine N-methyltransferase, H3 lysine-36 specific n=1 Tax=Polyplosphaeria fusca TaxID=682080 RepID=A0A9P4R1C6_9PLEO|nr:hypothetical protein EJ04DRAFT_562095 [Polyplosphaeria fusca]
MSDGETEKKSARLEPELRDMTIREGGALDWAGVRTATTRVKVEETDVPGRTPTPLSLSLQSQLKTRSGTQSPAKHHSPNTSTPGTDEHEEVLGGEITLKMEPGKAPKLARTASHKVVSKPPPSFLDLPDVTEEAKATFVVLPECTYGNKSLGTTEHALECDCQEEWDSVSRINNACGEDSDCINRATKMECIGDCSCGSACQNQRFLQKQYANVTVIKTEKKGYGLRANTNLKPGDFIFEYIGEVIDERAFRKRMIQYDEDGIKHFYFMSLTKGEFVDATKKGNLGRFCNHSCNPNCFVDKWVVGDKLRMGIFAERKIKAGEELVFNYNVDRYGADPQPCYCGEPNCTGFIGGRTQTDNATNLSHGIIEALGIDDGDGWDRAVAKKPRKKKASEDDEEYVNDIQPKYLEVEGVTKVMAALRQCQEKWIAVKLLSRIQQADDEKVGHRIIQMHGYNILKTTLTTWIEDFNVVLQVLNILYSLPRITRNKIQDSKIEEPIGDLRNSADERVATESAKLLEAWSKLEVAYRIPRVKRDPNAGTPVRTDNHFERRERGRERSRSRSRSPAIDAPKGPANIPQGPRAFRGNFGAFNAQRGPPRPRIPPYNPLPQGWFQATSGDGKIYYWTNTGVTQWQRPTQPIGSQPPPPPPKAKTNEQVLQDIISSITQNPTAQSQPSASATPQPAEDELKHRKKSKSEDWKNMPQEKRERAYEATIAPHIARVTSKYRNNFDKDTLKKLGKEFGKKIVRGDFKAGHVRDPSAKLKDSHVESISRAAKKFMEKAVAKKTEKDKAKAGKRSRTEPVSGTPAQSQPNDEASDDDMIAPSDDDESRSHPSPSGLSGELKRKWQEDDNLGLPKRTRTEPSPPVQPPPPPPPLEDMAVEMDGTNLTPVDDVSEIVNGMSGPSKSAVLLADGAKQGDAQSPTQLASPPTTTNGSCEHDSTANDSQHASHSKAQTAPVGDGI